MEDRRGDSDTHLGDKIIQSFLSAYERRIVDDYLFPQCVPPVVYLLLPPSPALAVLCSSLRVPGIASIFETGNSIDCSHTTIYRNSPIRTIPCTAAAVEERNKEPLGENRCRVVGK